METSFEYIRNYYGVPSERFREVIVDGQRGVIVGAVNSYIKVVFYDKESNSSYPCHPTSDVEYLDTFNRKPPRVKNQKSKDRYDHYMSLDSCMTFFEYLKSDWVLK